MKYPQLFVSLILIFYTSCQIQEINNDILSGNHNESHNHYLGLISSFGYSTDEIEELDTCFIISGETVLYKSDLDAFQDNTHRTKANAIGKLPKELQNIYIDPYYLSEEYSSLIQSAIEEWNSLQDCNIRFSTIYDDEPHTEWDNHVTLEISDTPELLTESDAMIRDNISSITHLIVSIDTSHETWQELEKEQQKYALMHSLGHLVGLKDSDENEYYIPGTYSDDTFSIMLPSDEINNANMADYWKGFSNLDIYNLSIMYPVLPYALSINVPEEMLTFNTYNITADYSSIKDIPNAKFIFSFISMPDGASNPISSQNTDKCIVRFDTPGAYSLKVSLFGGKEQTERFTITQDIYVDGDILSLPSIHNININIPFEVIWNYHAFGREAKISLRGHENIFDNGSDINLDINEVCNGKFNVTLKDYGSYTLFLEAQKDNGAILAQKRIEVNKLYTPKMTMDDSCIDLVNDWDYRTEPFKIGDLCEDVLSISAPHNLIQKPPYSTTLSDMGYLHGRLYFRVYRKYFRESFPVERAVQRRPVTDTTYCVEVRKYPNDGIIYTPDFPLYDKHVYYNPPIETELGIASYVKYRGYYGIVIPKSYIKIE